jgi:hypothetical protein
MNDMADSRSTLAGTTAAAGRPAAQPQSVVLVTEREVLFGTAAAARVRWDTNPSEPASRPRRRSQRHGFLERALMAREVGRL